jgi:glutamyl-tRNA reductase
MDFLVSGVNHRSASLEIRERLAVTVEQELPALESMKEHLGQGVILSTCNRSEFYTLAADSPSPDGLLDFISDYFSVPASELTPHLYTYRGEDCVRHLFRVAAGLDSMILGESQVLGQVRDAFATATLAQACRGPISRLFHRALRLGKRVRRETGLGKNALSVSRACVELARSAIGDLTERKILVIGAGEAGKLAARALARAGAGQILVTNRTLSRAQELARQIGGQAISFEDTRSALAEVDIAIGSADVPSFLLGMEDVATAVECRRGAPLLLMDIGVPRNFDPAVREIPGVVLYNTDDLDEVARVHRRELEEEARKAEDLVAQEAEQFMAWWHSLEVIPTVAALRRQAEAIRQRELARALKKLPDLTPQDRASLEAMTRAIVNKMLHDPVALLKERRSPHHLQMARELFRLEGE